HARSRGRDHSRRGACPGERDRGAHPARAAGDRRRDRPHRTVRLVMFTPRELALERGWPGRIDGDWVVQLAAQTLEGFFSGGGKAREHNLYPLEDVALRAPVLRPPSIRLFRDASTFEFGNTASIYGPDDEVRVPAPAEARYC